MPRRPRWSSACTASLRAGLTGTFAALILEYAAFNLAFAIWILRAFFASIPSEIEEAAAVDVRALRNVRPVVRARCPRTAPRAIFTHRDLEQDMWPSPS